MRAGRLSLAVVLWLVVAGNLVAVPLTPIPKGDIAIQLNPIATGLAAPLYGFAPPGDASRLFVLEQNGLIRVIQNGAMLPTPALNIQGRVAPPMNVASANEER